jgi:hypothetical protein
MVSDNSCLRCVEVELEPLPSPEGLLFLRCPACGREFARPAGGALRERWLGPLSIALYPVIFDKRPQNNVAGVAAQFRSRERQELTSLVAEIRLEISDPTQAVRDIHPGMLASEADLREFLTMLADELTKRIGEASGGP